MRESCRKVRTNRFLMASSVEIHLRRYCSFQLQLIGSRLLLKDLRCRRVRALFYLFGSQKTFLDIDHSLKTDSSRTI